MDQEYRLFGEVKKVRLGLVLTHATITDPALVVESAQQSKPMLVLADLDSNRSTICAALSRLKENAGTKHLPVIGFSSGNSPELQAAAEAAGVTLLVTETAILNHLAQLLDQALQVE